MEITKDNLLAKINFLHGELEELKDYYFVHETYQYLLSELDACQVELKRLEVRESFDAIDSGHYTRSEAPSVVRS